MDRSQRKEKQHLNKSQRGIANEYSEEQASMKLAWGSRGE